MAKRARGTTRPGQRRPVQKTTPRPAGTTGPAPSATDTTSASAGRRATAAETDGLPVAASAPSRGRTREASSAFSASATQEYAYVSADLRRIVRVAAGLFGTMFVLFLLIDVFAVIKI